MGIPTPKHVLDRIQELLRSGLCSREIAPLVEKSQKQVQKLMKQHDMDRLPQGGPRGDRNGFWRGGRVIDKTGYVLIKVFDHPYASRAGYVREHRLVAEKMLGRYLLPSEVVHHKDSNKQNNSPENLVVYANNGAHLADELKGRVPKWTEDGLRRIRAADPRRGRKRRTQVLPNPDQE